MNEDFEQLERAFAQQREAATDFCREFNASLPSRACPKCGEAGHCPGVPCFQCGYTHSVSWAILRDTEHGYDVVSLTDRRNVLASFTVPENL